MDESLVKINEKMVSIPPYLSASWKAIDHIRIVGGILVFTLKDGEMVEVPNFSTDQMRLVFESHMKFLESEGGRGPIRRDLPSDMRWAGPSPLLEGTAPPLELPRFPGMAPDMFNMLQHNVENKNMPDLPSEVVEKVAKILKVITPIDMDGFPKPEPHCNCPCCQVARLVHLEEEEMMEEVEEPVLDEELEFSQYAIEPIGEKLFEVTDKLSPEEKFSVYLGEPVGCTCGRAGCEHLIAVLKS